MLLPTAPRAHRRLNSRPSPYRSRGAGAHRRTQSTATNTSREDENHPNSSFFQPRGTALRSRASPTPTNAFPSERPLDPSIGIPRSSEVRTRSSSMETNNSFSSPILHASELQTTPDTPATPLLWDGELLYSQYQGRLIHEYRNWVAGRIWAPKIDVAHINYQIAHGISSPPAPAIPNPFRTFPPTDRCAKCGNVHVLEGNGCLYEALTQVTRYIPEFVHCVWTDAMFDRIWEADAGKTPLLELVYRRYKQIGLVNGAEFFLDPPPRVCPHGAIGPPRRDHI
ncbi:hypothetical protein BJ170DRAFT_99861 [Xylariales sp. AK1849]|nr:hypothetical protein BJ170DRAFT_99861 [Xylariales sp. AK1849]